MFFQFYSNSLKQITDNPAYKKKQNSLIPTARITRSAVSDTVKYPV